MTNDYKKQLELMVRKVNVLTALRIIQARDWDSPWFEGQYYFPLKYNPKGLVNLEACA